MASMLQMQDLFKTGLFSGPEQRPETIAELGVRKPFLEDLALKTSLCLRRSFCPPELS